MKPELQREVNALVTPASYEQFKREMNEWVGMQIEYRVAEVPVIVSHEFRKQLESSAADIISQCIQPDLLKLSDASLQSHYKVNNQNDRPLFSVADFAVCKDDSGQFVPRLIELQGFPSLFGYQYGYASRIAEHLHLKGMTPFMSGLDADTYFATLKRAIYSDHDPAECALIEIDPTTQKTRPDFIALEKYIGLQTINIRDVQKKGNRLVAKVEGRETPLTRVFNRAIIDELDEMNVDLQFSWKDDIDVEWAGHPNWYFRISKFLLPYLRGSAVPRCVFVSDLNEVPTDLDAYVLKPLYSFAGKGVNLNPTERDINDIPADKRSEWVLQQKVVYDPCVPTPAGDNKVEIRVMLVWFDDAPRPLPVMSLVRMGRGALMGARYNVDPWTGSSGCLFTE